MAPAEFTVEVLHSPEPRRVDQLRVVLQEGATVADALEASAWFDLSAFSLSVGVWGRKVALSEPLRAGDRIEVYRGLQVDPKEARRLRYRAHGEKLPKGHHRPRDWAKDLTQSPTQGIAQAKPDGA
jgi:putative ubiquitin-RnfH superfamily antitoxin RatB of RatAB toxin-antitoxin module